MDPQPGPSPPPSPPAFNPPSLPPRPTIARKPVPSLSERPSPPPLPPRPPKDDAKIADIDEKQHRTTPRSRRCYPATRQGRLCLWSLLSSLVVVIAVVIAVLATVLPHRTSFPDNGGHPLDVAHGGVSIGKPGDIEKLGANSTDHFVLTTNRSSVVTRLDPIVNPNALGSHLHRFHGSSYITPNLTKASDMQKLADCSTTVVQDDKSSYWVAQLYYRYPNGTLVAVHVYYTSLYYFMKAPIGVPIYPFPDNYNIVAGDPYRRTVNDSDPNHAALWYRCYRGESNDLRTDGFPDSQCKDGLVQGIFFPSCWDGIYADDGNYTGHVSYPADGPNGYCCPQTFPNKFIAVQFETTFATGDYPFNGSGNITWVLSNGDTTGYAIHADFMNGWKAETLQSAIDNCRYMNATDIAQAPTDPQNCPPLNKSIDWPMTYSCLAQTPIVNETVGESIPIANLPGCNAIWSGTGPKPPCPADAVEGGILELVEPTVWYRDEPYVN